LTTSPGPAAAWLTRRIQRQFSGGSCRSSRPITRERAEIERCISREGDHDLDPLTTMSTLRLQERIPMKKFVVQRPKAIAPPAPYEAEPWKDLCSFDDEASATKYKRDHGHIYGGEDKLQRFRLFGQLPGRNKLKAGIRLLVSPFPRN
jgi:hypothetical protein